MARLTIGQKAVRVLVFLMGVRKPRVATTLRAHGFTDAVLADGWRRMVALTDGRLDVTVPADADPRLLAELDAWENKWFPIVEVVLKYEHPEIHRQVFRNLAQTEGVEVIVSVSTLLKRLNEMPATPEAEAAKALLVARGFTVAVEAQAKDLLIQLGSIGRTVEDAPGPTEEEEAALEKSLWSWYLIWSTIARSSIKDRRLLKALGFLSAKGTPLSDEDPVPSPPLAGEEDDDLDVDTPSPFIAPED